MIRSWRVVVIAGLAVTGLLSMSVVRSNADNGSGPAPHKVIPDISKVDHEPQGRREDITRPGEVEVRQVWRNGRFWPVRVRITRELVHEANGQVTEVVKDVPGEVARVNREELPPPNPALANVNPTPEQLAQLEQSLPRSPAEALANARRGP